MTRGS